MQINSEQFEFLVGNVDVIKNMQTTKALPAFSDQMTGFLSALSRVLLKDKRSKAYADVMSYAYWIRHSSIIRARENHPDRNNRIGRGIAFHIAPSNVPVNFAVSMTSSVLAGNCTLIRVSNKPFEQVRIICDAMNALLQGEFSCLQPYFCIVRYGHNEEITKLLSEICDVRVIWGGDRTIEAIRKTAIPARAVELTFADRHSIAVIDSEAYLNADPVEIAKGFYTDTYYTDQNACSSPRLVVWLGERVEEAKKIFWEELEKIVLRDYDMQSIQSIDKYSSLCRLGMGRQGVLLCSDNNYIIRVKVEQITEDLMDYKESGGYFFEYTAKDIMEIVPALTKKCQTIAVLGIDQVKIKQLVFETGVRGVDRIVPLGQTMGLEFIWDGYKMIEMMSRFVYVGDYM